jgi:hypothetical protein
MTTVRSAAPKPTGFRPYLPKYTHPVSAQRLYTPADCRKVEEYFTSLGIHCSVIKDDRGIAGLIVPLTDGPEWQLAGPIYTFQIGQWVVIDHVTGRIGAMSDDEFIPSFRLA